MNIIENDVPIESRNGLNNTKYNRTQENLVNGIWLLRKVEIKNWKGKKEEKKTKIVTF